MTDLSTTAAPPGWVLACDLGSTSLRAGLVAADGVVAAEASLPAPAPRAEGDRSEVDPDLWWQGFTALCAELASKAPAEYARIAAVSICGATRAQVYLGADGRPLRPAMLWNDTRATAEAEALRAGEGSSHPEAAQINAFHPLARLAWLRREEPHHAAQIRLVLEPKDYLGFRLTGQAASDPVSMARLCAAAKPADGRDLVSIAGFPAGLIPPLRLPWQEIGPVTGALPPALARLAGLPVTAGSNDTYAAVVGLGAMQAGAAYNISGTTEVLGVLDDAPYHADGLIGLDWCGLHHLGGPSQNGADVALWLARLVGRSGAADLDALLASPRQSQPVLFLPYLSGERVPYWDADLRGAFLGLTRAHGPADIAHAVLEGVAFQNRLVLERAEAARGRPVTEVRMGGGGALNPLWRQIKADVLDRPVLLSAAREPGLVGAAALAFLGLGQFPTLAAAQVAMSAVAARHAPQPARVRHFERLYPLFRQAEAAVLPLSHALARF